MYAEANRNIGFDPSIIDKLKSRNGPAGRLLELLYQQGVEGWDTAFREFGFWVEEPETGQGHLAPGFDEYVGTDPNELQDVAGYILGSKTHPLGGDGPVNIFNQSTGMPHYIYDLVDQMGLDSKVYRPKLYTVEVRVQNPLVTKSQAQARSAKSKGYDSVVYWGADLVRGVPEVAVWDPQKVKVRRIEIVT